MAAVFLMILAMLMLVGGLMSFLESRGNHTASISGIFFFSVGAALLLAPVGGMGGVIFALSYLFFIPFFMFYWKYNSIPMSKAKEKRRAKLGMWSMVALFLTCAFWGLAMTVSGYM